MSAKRSDPHISATGSTLSVTERDALATSLRRIAALAALLTVSSSRSADDTVEAEMVGEAASIIAEEAARMRTVLDTATAGPNAAR